MSRRGHALAAFALAAVVALTGCTPDAEPIPTTTPTNVDLSQVDVTDGDRNGIEYVSGADAVDAVLAAMEDGGPVAVSGWFQERADEDGAGPTRRLEIDFAGTETRFRAEVTASGVAVAVVVVAGRAYLTGDARLAGLLGVPEADGGVVCLASDDRRVTAWAPALSPSGLVESILGDTDAVSLDPTGEPDEETGTMEFVIGAGGSPIGSLVVSTTGPPVPLRLVAADPRGDVDLTFAWGEDPGVTAPTDVAVPCP